MQPSHNRSPLGVSGSASTSPSKERSPLYSFLSYGLHSHAAGGTAAAESRARRPNFPRTEGSLKLPRSMHLCGGTGFILDFGVLDYKGLNMLHLPVVRSVLLTTAHW